MAEGPVQFQWQEATIRGIGMPTLRTRSVVLEPSRPIDFLAGQHVDIRLTAPDGYQAQRSYSIASAPGTGSAFELIIELLPDGEVSPFFHEVAAVGDAIEFRGPIGGHFNWDPTMAGPILLVGGGSGVVPLLSILRHRAQVAPGVRAALVYSARAFADVIHRDELVRRADREENLALRLALTRDPHAPREYHAGRIDRGLVHMALEWVGGGELTAYVCGANAFVEAANELLLAAGVNFHAIRNERFGGAPPA